MKKLIYFFSDKYLLDKINGVSSNIYLSILMLLSIAIRGRQYLANRSFWLDEAFLANNIKDRDYMQLLQPLDYSQVAPIGFLYIEKLMSNIFGVNELALRLVPFLCSLMATFFLFKLVENLTKKKVEAILTTFAFLVPISMTYFASELKQYMLDLCAGLVLFYFYFVHIRNKSNNSGSLFFGIVGAVLIWFSNVVIIVLVALTLVEGISIVKRSNLKSFSYFLAGLLLWSSSFLLYYIYFIKNHPHTAGMQAYWAHGFMPLKFSDSLIWLQKSFDSIFRNTISYYEMTIPALFLFIVGIIGVGVQKQKRQILILLVPILMHLLLSALKLYPFSDRLVLYLVPLFLIFIIEGLVFISQITRSNYKTFTFILLSGLFLGFSVLRTKHYFIHPIMKEDIKPVLAYISKNKKDDDIVYVYSGSMAPFKFYREMYFDDSDEIIIGVSSGDNFKKFVNQFENIHGRIWIIFSHMNPPQGIQYLEEKLSEYEQLDTYITDGAKTYLISKP